jgi:hypothetical protein
MGQWGYVNRQGFHVEETANSGENFPGPDLPKPSDFIDDDPGVGAGIPVSVSSGDTGLPETLR